MKCSGCAHDVPDAARFCGKCGARLLTPCPRCGTTNPPGNTFCQECGGSLAAPSAPPPKGAGGPPVAPRYGSPQTYTPKHLADKILSSRSAVEGERKQVTVLFTDVSGFTAMSERADPEEMHEIMDRAFEIILVAVHRYEGTVNQFLGDGVMALFGAPIAHEDHPSRALRAALEIQQGIQPLRDDVRRRHRTEFRLRIGINTGPVVVGAIGSDLRMDYTAVGDTTNLAARMLNVAQPGQIVMAPLTHRMTAGFFAVEDLGEFEIKGKSAPVRAYAVTAELHGRTRIEVSKERGLTPLAGRQSELIALTAAYERAAEGDGGVVLVLGHPGVGKSRLLYEFLRRIDGQCRELEATCVSYGRSSPYLPVVEMVRRHARIGEHAGAGEVRAAVIAAMRAAGIEDDDAVAIFAHFLGVEAPAELLTRLGAQLKDRTVALLTRMLLTDDRPLVLVIENIHWIDPSSQEFLDHFIRALASRRVLLVLTCRPDSSTAWLPMAPTFTVTLGGLHGAQAAGMIRTLLGVERVSAPLVDIIVAKSEGNPLFVEEIVRQLVETDGIHVVDGEAGLSRSDVTVPETVHDIIAARIDRLAEPLKQTLQGAAVVGRQFSTPLLRRLLQHEEPLLVERLQNLQGLDFVFLLNRLLYSFKHALTQEVVYAGLLERRRRLYHAAVGRGLEELYDGRIDEVVDLLAHHFERSGEHDKAVDYAILAGEKAQRRWANAEAVSHFEAALERLDTMPDSHANRLRRIDAVIKQAETKFALGRHAEEISALEAIHEIVDAAADPPRRAAWYFWAGFLHSLTGAPAQVSIDYCQHASEIANAGGFEDLRAYAECCLAHVYLVAGRLHDGLKAGEFALGVFEARGNLWWACRTLWTLMPIANACADWERSRAYSERALRHATAVDDLRLKIVAHMRRGTTEIQRGDAARGIAACDEAHAMSPAPFDVTMATAMKACGLMKSGSVRAGMAQLQEAVAWLENAGLRYTSSLFTLWLADGCLRAHENHGAQQHAERVVAVARERGYRHLEGVALRLLGEALTERDPVRARETLEAAADILNDVGARNEVAKTWLAQASLQKAAGDIASATALAERALATFEALGTLDEPVRARAMLALLLAAH